MEPPQKIIPAINDQTMIHPPPITRTVEALDENTQIPGELKLDKHGNLLKEYLIYDGFSADLILAYNHWIQEILRRQIGSRQLRIPSANGNLIFKKISYSRPNILPYQCRNRNMTYSFEISAYVAFVPDGTNPEDAPIIDHVSIGKIPIMIGSVVSHMYNKSEEEILAMRECPKDPGGYFIIKGVEKLVIIQEKVRINRVLVWVGDKKTKVKGRGRLTCRMTSPTKTGTIVVLLREGESKNIRLSLPFFGKKEKKNDKNEPRSIEVLQAFRVLGDRLDALLGIQDPNQQYSNYDNIITHIMTFADHNPRKIKKILLALQPSLFKATMASDAVGNSYDYIGRKMGLSPEQSTSLKQAGILRGFLNELFPQVNNSDVSEDIIIKQKYDMLAIMVARLIEVMAGARKLDDRDSWSNKRLVSAAGSMEQLFNSAWILSMNKTEEEIRKNLTELPITKEALKKFFKFQSDITENFVTSFNSTNWGIKNSKYKENITEILTRHNMIATYSHLRRINTPTNQKAKQPHIRLVQMSQIGYICPIETPEGARCGLVKNLAIGATISINRDSTIIRELITQYLNPIRDDGKGYSTKCLLNGIFIGWCQGQFMYELCLYYRRINQMFPPDTAIVFDLEERGDGTALDGTLYLYSDGGRPIRPLLIVGDGKFPLIDGDGKVMKNPDGKERKSTPERLIIDELNLWKANFSTLLRRGCVEYIDAFEQENIMLAQSLSYIENRIDMRRDLQIRLRQAEERYTALQAGKKIEKEEEINFERKNLCSTQEDDLDYWDLEEAEEELNNAQTAFDNFSKEPPYTHCELDPTAILGVSASIIPMPNRNQAPRNVYQCVNINTPILTPKGLVEIKDLQNGDQIVTIDPKTRLSQITSIKNHFIIHPAKYKKNMFRISTLSGRKIEVTEDHPFLTERGFILAGKLQKDDLLAIYSEIEEEIIENYDQLSQLLQKNGIEKDLIDQKIEGIELPLIDLEIAVIIEWFKHYQDGLVHLKNQVEQIYSLRQWQELIRYNGQCLYLPIKEILPIESMLVSDFETVDDTHTMIANSFVTHNCTMGKQALSIYHSNYMERFDTTAKLLAYPQRSLFEPQSNIFTGLSDMPAGETVTIAFLPWRGWGQEDNFIFNKSAVEQGLFRYIKYITKKTSLKKGDFTERFGRPKPKKGEPEDRYENIGTDGLPIVGSVMKQGQAVIGKLTLKSGKKEGHREEENTSLYIGLSEDGIVERVLLTKNEDGLDTVKVRIRQVRSPEAGDKFCLTPDHQVLTKRGWIPIPDLTKKDQVATLENDRLVYSTPEEIISFPYEGPIYHLTSDEVELSVTPDHRMYTRESGKEFDFLLAKEIGNKTLTYKKNVSFPEESEEDLPIRGSFLSLEEKSLPKWCHDLNPQQSQNLLQEILDFSGIFLTSSLSLANDLTILALHAGWSANLSEQEEFSPTNGGPVGPRPCEQLVCSQEFSPTNGGPTGHCEPCEKEKKYLVTLNRENNRPRVEASSGRWEPYSGQVYCCTVPSGVFYVRKNGKPVWTGNSPRHAQKGTIGILVDEADMPFVDDPNSPMDGMRPSIIVNPMSIISRMTIGMMIEVAASKPASMSGDRINATAFRSFDFDELRKNLIHYGFRESGRETMVDGMTHKKLKGQVFTGPCYYQALRHHVKDKFQMRGKGLINTMTRQPVGGRGRGGGQRFGEMERDTLISHGGSAMLRDRLCDASDAFTTIICRTCGNIAISNVATKEMICRNCEGKGEFGEVTIPYAFKLLIHLLWAAGISMTLRTRKVEQD